MAAPVERAWGVIGDFGHEHTWLPGMEHCRRDTDQVQVGTSRYCRLRKPVMGRTEVKETLFEFEPGRTLAYTLDGPAGPFATAGSRWTVTRNETGTTVLVEGFFTPKNWVSRWIVWPIAKPAIKRLTQRTLHQLEDYLAT